MPTIVVELAEEVASHIEGTGYSEEVTVERVNLPVDDMSNFPEGSPPLVTVFPGVRRLEDSFRDAMLREYRVAVAIRQKLPVDLSDSERLARQDELIGLAEEIEQSLEQTEFVISDAVCTHIGSEGSGGDTPPFLTGPMESRNQFTLGITAIYQVVF